MLQFRTWLNVGNHKNTNKRFKAKWIYFMWEDYTEEKYKKELELCMTGINHIHTPFKIEFRIKN